MKSKILAATAAVVVVLLGTTSPAAAAPGIWAQWTMTGGSLAYSGTMTIPTPNFPAATWTSNARADSAVESGASTYFTEPTPVGAVYGPSQNQPYLRLRPAADNPTSPSTTTYTFDTPTPVGNWAFVLGDIDADEAELSATDADGNPIDVAGLGWQGGFNICTYTPRPPACSGVTDTDQPTWIPGVNSGVLRGNPRAVDTTGSTGWFQPTAPIKTLTIQFRQRSGFPVYQTWFVSLPQPPPTTTTTTTTTTVPPTTAPPVPPTTAMPAPPGPAVMNPTPPAPRPTHRTLPATGHAATTEAALGVALVVVGAAVGLVARRLRRPAT